MSGPGLLPPARILLLALAVPLLAMIPTWQGYRAEAPPERIFLGFRYMAGDHYQYAAFMRQAAEQGSLLMANPFTSEPQKGVFVLLYFWLAGLASRLTLGSLILSWELLRLIGGFLYIVVFWHFIGHYLQQRTQRDFATLLFAAAGGLDWLAELARVTVWRFEKPMWYPYDYHWNWSTFGTMATPNWIWPALCFLLACHRILRGGRPAAALSFALLPLVWFLHPYTGMVAYLALGLVPVVTAAACAAGVEPQGRTAIRRSLVAVLPGLASFGLVAAYLVWARADEVFRMNSARGFTWTNRFSVLWYPLTYGLLLPLAWLGLRALARGGGLARDLAVAWLAAALLLSINPWYAGVKFQYLVFVPLAALAAVGACGAARSAGGLGRLARSRAARFAICLALLLNAPLSLVKDMQAAARDPNIFLSAAELDAMRWLADRPGGVVLCHPWSGNRIAWLSGKTVYAGHWFVTIDMAGKSRRLAHFFSASTPPREKEAFLRESGARYVYHGPPEARLGPIDQRLALRRVYDGAGVAIYEVEPPR